MRPLRLAAASSLVVAVLVIGASCGGHPPTQPTPGGGGSDQQPPPNNPPVINAINVQGTRPKEPANFADIGETIELSAEVHDDETSVEQLQFDWSAPSGTFEGTGSKVTWTAPAELPESAPVSAKISLKVTEKYGRPGGPQAFQHEVTGSANVSLHDSKDEVGSMARQFLLDFSDTNIHDADYIMRNFGRNRCPDPGDVDDERSDVTNHYKNYRTVAFRIGTPVVTVNFGGTCPFRNRAGDACAVVPAFWDSIDVRTKARGSVDGNDFLSAIYSSADSRWWLCSSDYQAHLLSGAVLHGFIR